MNPDASFNEVYIHNTMTSSDSEIDICTISHSPEPHSLRFWSFHRTLGDHGEPLACNGNRSDYIPIG